MSRLYKQPTTKKLPPGAVVRIIRGERVATWTDRRGKEHHAFTNEDGTRIRVLSKKWYGEWRNADGEIVRQALSPDKRAAQLMLNEKVREAEMGKAGVRNPFAAHAHRPLLEHLADFEAVLRARDSGDEHVKQTVGYIRMILNGCGFVHAADVSASAVEGFLADLRRDPPVPVIDPTKEWYTIGEAAAAIGSKVHCIAPLVRRYRLAATGYGRARRFPRATVEFLAGLKGRGKSVKTTNMYLAAIKQFCRWMVEDRRTGDNPLVGLKRGNVRMDRRHDRRALPPEELRQILDAALVSPKTFHGMNGRDRHHIYLAAMTTGFRAEELANLLPESFSLDAEPPTATLPARLTKNKTTVIQPLPPEAAEALRDYLRDKPAGQPVWPGTWAEKAVNMLRIELDATGIPYSVQGPDGPLYADFHALRHSFIALLDRTGATLKEAMQLARHSDPRLTMAVYGRARLHDLGATVGKLPPLLPAANPQKATGTAG